MYKILKNVTFLTFFSKHKNSNNIRRTYGGYTKKIRKAQNLKKRHVLYLLVFVYFTLYIQEKSTTFVP